MSYQCSIDLSKDFAEAITRCAEAKFNILGLRIFTGWSAENVDYRSVRLEVAQLTEALSLVKALTSRFEARLNVAISAPQEYEEKNGLEVTIFHAQRVRRNPFVVVAPPGSPASLISNDSLESTSNSL